MENEAESVPHTLPLDGSAPRREGPRPPQPGGGENGEPDREQGGRGTQIEEAAELPVYKERGAFRYVASAGVCTLWMRGTDRFGIVYKRFFYDTPPGTVPNPDTDRYLSLLGICLLGWEFGFHPPARVGNAVRRLLARRGWRLPLT